MASFSAEVGQFVTQQLVEQINRPLGEATCLPNESYTSQAFFTLEQRLIFRRSWVLAGFVHEIPNPGDIRPVEVAGMPLLLVRDEAGGIGVFQNVCRHRGALLVDAPCQEKRSIVCPYHSWTYSLEGHLVRRPHFYGGNRHDVSHGRNDKGALVAVRAEVWHHWVLVNIDGNAAPLHEHLAFIDNAIAGYDFSAMTHAGSLKFDIGTNWKFAHENYIEPYHVFSAHPRLNAFVPMNERRPSAVADHIMWNHYQFKSPEEGRGLGLPHFPGLNEEQRMRGVWFTLFPTFGIEIYPDHIALFHVDPISPGRSRETIAVYLTHEAASAARYETQRQSVLEMWESLNKEDIGLLESLQKGREAPGYDGGLLSPYWDEAPRHFARLVANTLLSESQQLDRDS